MATLMQQQPTMRNKALETIPQKNFPLVHVLTSKTETDELQKSEPFNFEKTIKFLTDPHSAHLLDRRIRICQKLCRHYQNGFIIKDLNHFMKIFNILGDLCQQQPNYIDAFVQILQHCSKPFLLDKATDGEIYSSALVAFYSDYGYLLRIPIKRIQKCILETLFKSIQSSNKSPVPYDDYDSLKPTTIEYLLRTQRNSDLCETLVKTLSLVENDLSLRILIIKLLQVLAAKHPECIAKMLTQDCVNRLVLRMNDPDSTGELLFRTIELLWNIFENGDEEQIGEQLNSRLTISLLQEAFLGQITQSHSHYHRQLRNDILVVCSLIIGLKPDAPFVETGFAKQLLLFASFPELRSNNPLVKNFKLTKSQEDFEFKKLLFNTVVVLSRNPVVNELLIESRVLLTFLSYIEPLPRKSQPGTVFDWSLSQTEDLQLHAIAALTILLPRSLNEYFEYHVGTRLLLFYEWTISDDEYQSQGNSFFGKGGRHNKRSQLKYIFRLFRSLLSIKDERVQIDLCDQGIIPSITSYLRRMGQQKSINLDYVDLDIICDGLFILSCLCELDVHRKEIFGTEGIETLIQLLVIESHCVCGGLGYHRLLVAAIDCVWCCVVGSVINEDEFIQKQGIFALLDLIEANPKSLQNVILGCVLDLSENSKCLHFIMTWQGQKQQQFTHLLCELWRDEEREIHVSRTEKGVIHDHSKPLMGVLQQSVQITPLARFEPSRSVLDLIDNMRSKIYGFFCKLGFSELPGLHEEDSVTLCIIENFLDFKMGEIWQEIVTELDIEGVKLVAPDGEAVDTILRATEERGLAVAATQNYILEQYNKQDLQFEKAFYDDLIRNHLFKEKRLEQWKIYLARTSKYPLLMAAKDYQSQAIRQSRPEEKDYSGYHTVHNLEIPNLSITAFTGPFLQIESTPVELLNKHHQVELIS
ncbi:unnamed protein product [Rotaria socialis]|uniref:Cilia- and flagella-associated protein 69 ARM repeats domain-containing protein n=1 Tax=Rotaria socialis TaxID=392032 RepID=A0A821NN74_9BILA|nr:unnamed protein product [Rotaria socialis]CAF3405170.1 unnamed protein product [Rotaria socialis]CAF3457126.1 unnamed protein product [Rotaria socialis]CAF3536522.1 unnamed protein product [Rotaria socialis]CAF3558358.1 unnamed protein product [Rotaria socialis]